MNNPESGFPWWMKFFTAIICLFLLAALWFNQINSLPEIKTPVTKMPNPNAFDYFTSASNSLVDKEIIDGANTKNPIIPINPSAAYLMNNLRFPTETEKAKAIKVNSNTFSYFRAGLGYEYKAPQMKTFDDSGPNFSKFRRLTRLLLMESKSYESKKNWNAAMNSRLDGIEFGVKIADGNSLISMLVGVALEAISRKDINIVTGNLNAKESINAAKRLENILENRIPFINSIEEQKNIWIRTYIDIFQKPGWRNDMSEAIMITDDYSGFEAFVIKSKMTIYGKRSIMNGLIGYYDEFVEISKKPYGAKIQPTAIPKDLVNQMTCHLGVDEKPRFKYENARALEYVLLLELALKAYRLENGTYPENLKMLIPKYLTKLPDDPFALKGTLKYKKKGDSYLLYSFGPDCKDNGGTPVLYSAKRNYLDKDSKGDIVAGINYK